MKCEEFKQQLEAQGHQGLSDEALRHKRDCELCHSYARDWQLRDALTHMPLPEPRAGFADEAIKRAINRSASKRLLTGTGLSAAAAVVVAVILALLFGPLQTINRPLNDAARVAVSESAQAPAKETTVRLVIEAKQARDDALLTIDLAENIELKGYPEQRRVAWRTKVKQGRNLLELPLLVENSDNGYVNVSYSYNGSRKELQIPVHEDSASS